MKPSVKLLLLTLIYGMASMILVYASGNSETKAAKRYQAHAYLEAFQLPIPNVIMPRNTWIVQAQAKTHSGEQIISE